MCVSSSCIVCFQCGARTKACSGCECSSLMWLHSPFRMWHVVDWCHTNCREFFHSLPLLLLQSSQHAPCDGPPSIQKTIWLAWLCIFGFCVAVLRFVFHISLWLALPLWCGILRMESSVLVSWSSSFRILLIMRGDVFRTLSQARTPKHFRLCFQAVSRPFQCGALKKSSCLWVHHLMVVAEVCVQVVEGGNPFGNSPPTPPNPITMFVPWMLQLHIFGSISLLKWLEDCGCG